MTGNSDEIHGMWFLSLVLLVITGLVLGAVMKRRKLSIRKLIKDDRGTIHLPFVALLPLIIFSVALVIETTNLVVAAVGVKSACAAATRAATIWLATDRVAESSLDWQVTEGFWLKRHQCNRIKDAVTINLAPFSTGLIQADSVPRPSLLRVQRAEAYADHFLRTHAGRASRDFLINQFLYADTARIQIHVNESSNPFEGNHSFPAGWFPVDVRYQKRDRVRGEDYRSEVTVRVEHHVPFRLPLLGRLLGEEPWPGAGFYARKIVAEYSLPKEGFQTTDQRPGINVFRK